MLIDLHPSSTAGSGLRFRQTLHKQSSDPSDNIFIDCPHCGMPNRTMKDASANKEGEATSYITVNQEIPGGTEAVVEARRVSGCRFCRHDFTKSTYKKPLFTGVNMSGR